jgi:hypothetical protein
MEFPRTELEIFCRKLELPSDNISKDLSAYPDDESNLLKIFPLSHDASSSPEVDEKSPDALSSSLIVDLNIVGQPYWLFRRRAGVGGSAEGHQ